MNKETRNLLEDSFDRIPELSNHTIDAYHIKQLPGYTNLNFHLKSAQQDWVLRIPQEKTNAYIDRRVEAHNANIAYKLGLAPECLWRDDSGYSLSNTISHSGSLTMQDLNNPELLKQLVTTLQRLHRSDEIFQGTVDVDDLLAVYYHLMPKSKQRLLVDSYQDAKSKVKIVSQQDNRLVPSHNDLVLENILFDSHRIWIIDWEYATMASPYWDLATLCNEGQFTVSQAENLLSLYENKGQALDLKILSYYRDLLNALSTFWMTALADENS